MILLLIFNRRYLSLSSSIDNYRCHTKVFFNSFLSITTRLGSWLPLLLFDYRAYFDKRPYFKKEMWSGDII